HGRFVIVVDDDIDPSDMKEVIWAVSTRCDPKTAISIIDGCWSTPLDPAMHPDQRDAGNFINSRAILNACRPYAWRDRFPPVNALSAELKKKIEEKWKKELA
ncbi:MAG TPA: UbiD family decarboxylase, partial [Candidatus Binatia bacterium]|nr:UbiD family decarboxylase [Candidatus Binatia bacterium]